MAEQGPGKRVVVSIEHRLLGLYERLEREMEELRQLLFHGSRPPLLQGSPPFGLAGTEWAPAVDAYEKDGTFVVKAELPGVNKEDIQVLLDTGLLTIRGTREEGQEVKDAHHHTLERFAGSFSRCFAMPEDVDAEKVEARFKDGILEVRVPMPAVVQATAVTIPITG